MPNIKEEIGKLIELQTIDKSIFDFRREKAATPGLIDELQKEFDAKKTHLKNLEESRQKLLLRQKQKEGDLATKEEGIKKTQGQLGQLKTNKEYQAKLAEIESLKADKSLIEEEVLRLMDEVETSRPPIEAEKQNLVEEEKKFGTRKNEILNRLKDIDAQLVNLEGKRKILAGTVDKKTLEHYEHILPAKEGVALALVVNNSCRGCFMHVPHQVIHEIKMYDRLVTCETCSRILYLEEDVHS